MNDVAGPHSVKFCFRLLLLNNWASTENEEGKAAKFIVEWDQGYWSETVYRRRRLVFLVI